VYDLWYYTHAHTTHFLTTHTSTPTGRGTPLKRACPANHSSPAQTKQAACLHTPTPHTSTPTGPSRSRLYIPHSSTPTKHTKQAVAQRHHPTFLLFHTPPKQIVCHDQDIFHTPQSMPNKPFITCTAESGQYILHSTHARPLPSFTPTRHGRHTVHYTQKESMPSKRTAGIACMPTHTHPTLPHLQDIHQGIAHLHTQGRPRSTHLYTPHGSTHTLHFHTYRA
jgi:hypothetical protein